MAGSIIAKDIARPFSKVYKDELIQQAFLILEGRKETHLVVVNDEDEPIGIVSYKDFQKILTDRLRRKSLAKVYVSSLMTPNPISVPEDSTLGEVAKLMVERGISSVLVAGSDGSVSRIITKKDILLKVPLPSDPVRGLMTKEPIVVAPGTKLNTVEYLMRAHKISTLPVVEGDTLVGYLDVYTLTGFLVDAFTNPDIKHPERLLLEVTAEDIMRGAFFAVADEPIESFAREIARRKYKGAPIVADDQNRRVIGIATETDVTMLLAGIKTIQ